MFNVVFGFQIATCSIIGQLIGANNIQLAKKVERLSFMFSSTVNFSIFMILSFIGRNVFYVYTRNEELIKLVDTMF